MKKKSPSLAKELNSLMEKTKEVHDLLKRSQDEEQAFLEKSEEEIKSLADSKKLFCGVILTEADILEIIKIAIKAGPGETVKIPFKLYYLDTNE
jgi:hypothetical protein